MQIRNKYYPYPVIIEGGDYYVDSEFTTSFNQTMEGYNIKLDLKAILKNDELERLLKTRDVEIVHHIECPQTCYRKIKRTYEYDDTHVLEDSEVNGVVQICSFLVATRNLDKYSNEKFASDYKGFKFNIEKGCILAVGNQYNLRINKVRDDLNNASSIFSIVPSKDPADVSMNVDLGQQKIIISLPEKNFHQYSNIQGLIEVQPVLHSMVIIPALLYVFSELRASGEQLYLYEDYRWFRSLRKACAAIDIIIDEESLKNINPLKVSQMLLNGPITKGIEFFSITGGNYED